MERVKGLKKLIKKIQEVPKELEPLLGGVIEGNCMEIVSNAKEEAPVDTGKLQQSQAFDKLDDLIYEVKSNATGLAPYDVFVEYGTRFQKAQPFFWPSVMKQEKVLLNDIQDLIDSEFSNI